MGGSTWVNFNSGFQSDFCKLGVERWTLGVCLFRPYDRRYIHRLT